MPPEQYYRKFTRQEFERTVIGAETIRLRAMFEKAAGPVFYEPYAPYILHTVHPANDFNLACHYALSGRRSEQSDIINLHVSMGNGGWDDFSKKLFEYGGPHEQVSADFWIMPKEPENVYFMHGNKFQCFEAAPYTAEASDAFLREMAQYIRRMQAGYIVNFAQDKIDVWTASKKAGQIAPALDRWKQEATSRFELNPGAKGAVSRLVAESPAWPRAYKPTY